MADTVPKKLSGLRRKASLKVVFAVKKKSRNPTYLKVYKILQKSEKDRSKEENELLSNSASVVKQVLTRLEKRQQILAREKEFEDSSELLEEKCAKLAEAIAGAKHLVVYSGAGVSTAAKIPDYRGTNGIWTRLQQGKEIGDHDLSVAEPTTAHMALYSLYKNGFLKYIVSQNCDGLHLRSGLPRRALSEVHGNMNLEVCELCNIQYWRAFDVTTHTARYAHQTARRCSACACPLRDTIVHFGERGSLAWPINWSGACHAAKQADMILCIGSSLKVLKRYPWLWGMDKPVSKRPKLYIVNLQWTPKDFQATIKINGKCDDVMKLVMGYLNIKIPEYDRTMDPIFHHCTMLHPLEEHTISSSLMLVPPDIKRFKKEAIDIDEISQHKLDEIVYGIKKEEIIWRPFGKEIIFNSGKVIKEEDRIAEEPCHSNISVQADIFDQVYQEIAKKVLQQTNTAYYQSIYEPLDLSKPECRFCHDSYGSSCMFYLKRTAKVPEKGRPCYCCDSEDDTSDNGGSDQADRKTPSNPGWFGKGYRKKIKKKR